MRRYTSAILIACMLIQLFGCGFNKTFSEITLGELNNYDSSKIKIITNEDEFIIGEEDAKYRTYWEEGDSSIIVIKKEVFRGNITIPLDTTRIKYDEIKRIEVEKSESVNLTTWETVSLVTGAVLLAALFITLLIGSVENSLSW